jgi:hypothetical protein
MPSRKETLRRPAEANPVMHAFAMAAGITWNFAAPYPPASGNQLNRKANSPNKTCI